MALRVVQAPQPFIALETAKLHLRVDHGDDDDLIKAFIAAAVQWIDGPSGWLGRAIGAQRLEWSSPGWLGLNFRLPMPPVIADNVVIQYRDRSGEIQTLDASAYAVHDNRIWFRQISSMPAVGAYSDAVIITYGAGYAEGQVPAPITIATLMLVAHFYQNREATGDRSPAAMPFGVDALLSPYRIWSV